MAHETVPFHDGLQETRFGLLYYDSGLHTLFEIVELRRRSGELLGEMTVRCNLEGARGQLDGNRLRQGNFNFSSVTTRQTWARALSAMVPEELNRTLEWGNLLERVSQAVLDHERTGSLKGGVLTGAGQGQAGGRPWAAYPILPDHETAMLYARGGAGKTSLLAVLALSLGLGRSLIPGIRVDRPYRALVLDWETNRATAEDLYGLIVRSYGVAPPPTVWYEPMEQPFERLLPKVANAMDKHQTDLLVVDSVQMAMQSSSEYSDAAESITRLHQGLRRLGAWGLLIDHIASDEVKAQRLSLKPYGSVYKSNIIRHSVNLLVGERIGETSRAYLACPKSNVLRDRWAMEGVFERTDEVIRWEFGPMDYDLYERLATSPTYSDRAATGTATERRLVDRVTSVLAAAGPTATADIAGYLDEPDTGKIRAVISRYRDRFTKTEDGRWCLSEGDVA